MSRRRQPAIVLCVGGHDPSAAGIQADIETCLALDCLALTVVTAWTTQNTRGVSKVEPAHATDMRAQIDALRADFDIAAIKLGLIPTAALAACLGEVLRGPLAGRPLVVDPVLRAGSGGELTTGDLAVALVEHILPMASVVTPNRQEAETLGGAEPTQRLFATGCGAVLVTNLTDDSETLTNRLFLAADRAEDFSMPRYAGVYHGTGCTLASGIACGLAQGQDLRAAVIAAQKFVHRSVACAFRTGSQQLIPNRTVSRL
jgi:hydroxymethylpyrimidine/phosphomethylpyrimidine kinase